MFAAGQVTVCPYLVFAARTPQSRHHPDEFIVGNIFTDPDIATCLDTYRLDWHDGVFILGVFGSRGRYCRSV